MDKIYGYTPTPFDLKASLVQLLKQIWNFNTYDDKHECIDCLSFEEWCIDFAKTKRKADFDFAIRKIKETDRSFIDFDRISVFESEKILSLFKKKIFFFSLK